MQLKYFLGEGILDLKFLQKILGEKVLKMYVHKYGHRISGLIYKFLLFLRGRGELTFLSQK